MNVVDSTKEQVKHIVEKVAQKVTEKTSTTGVGFGSSLQAVTVGRPRAEVMGLFTDANRLSQVFGDVAEVSSTGPDRMRWKFTAAGDDGSPGPEWECVVVTEDDARLRFVDVDPNQKAEITLEFRDAPRDRGTEVIARASSPAPGALTGLLTYKALYRASALLTTGEVPTLRHNPSARTSNR
ncbi:hypothetical protein CIW49_00340 [Mycolicibacterium sp. P1-18]|uniref:hypothetical protein n=1 Tax=Mycolicibacterium sp. P1-18 TaxID=2024615 RepID=UPI0011F10ADB|nr:hypothetical protein [Mycolicibacterium sp. P1-18]KAA0101865.1 hypothetical protein CIW49_00340 [Mycolicibacterium sp. P1-18]